jgi:hypothetical protein
MTENCKLRKAILFAFYNILQWNFGILLILWCSFKLWWNFCLDLLSSKFWLIGEWSISFSNPFFDIVKKDYRLVPCCRSRYALGQRSHTELWSKLHDLPFPHPPNWSGIWWSDLSVVWLPLNWIELERYLQGQASPSLFTHVKSAQSVNRDKNTRDLTSRRRHACLVVRFDFKKKIGTLSEGSV